MSSNTEKHNKETRKGGKLIPALCSIAGILMVAAVIAFALALVLPPRFGYQIYNIMTGSMAPEIPVGSIIYVKPKEPVQIEVGEVVVYDRVIEDNAYDLEGFIVAHRVIENHTLEGELITKGDANEEPDLSPVSYNSVKGVVTFHMAKMGQFMTIYTTLPGKICLLGVALCGVLLNILAGRLRDR